MDFAVNKPQAHAAPWLRITRDLCRFAFQPFVWIAVAYLIFPVPQSCCAQSAQSADTPVNQEHQVSEVVIQGNQRIPDHELANLMSTRPGRYFDPDLLQQDVNKLWRLPGVRRVRGPYLNRTPQGIVITIEIEERQIIQKLEFVGNRGISDRALKKETGLEEGQPLDLHLVRMAKGRIEDMYREKGYPRTQVELADQEAVQNGEIVFVIHEDQKQKIWNVTFEGNTFVSDARLKNFIKSKPGIMKIVGGNVKRDEIDQDVLRLSSYYKNFGFFNVRIGREIEESNDGRWLTVRFIIDEGPRYRVRNVSFLGPRAYEPQELAKLLSHKPQDNELPEFNAAKMNQDVTALRELYGSQGFVFAKVEAEPRFLEEPGLLDLVYKIDEGEQYVVGNIHVHIEGDYGITRRETVLNRLSLRPGDLINATELRATERRLGSAQIFAAGGQGGPGPRVVVRTPELDQLNKIQQASGVEDSNPRFR